MENFFDRLSTNKYIKAFLMFYVLFSVFIILYLSDRLICKDLENVSNKVMLDDNWDIVINDEEYHNIDLTTFKFDAVNKGDYIIMTRLLPDNWNFDQTAMHLHIRQTTVDIFVDDRIIYQYGHERNALGKTVGSGIQLINFSNDYQGKTIKIVLHVTENRAFSKFDSIWLSEWNNSYRFILTENRLPLLLGCFLIVFGAVVIIVIIFGVSVSRKYVSVLFLSAFSICMGLWTLCYNNVILIFSIPLYSISLMEYMALLLAPIPILGYMYSYVKQLEKRKLTIIYNILFITQFVLSIVAIILHTKDIIHCAAILIYFQVLFAFHAIFFTYILHQNLKNSTKKRKIYSIGLFIILVSIVYELLSYSFNRYIGQNIFTIKGVASLGIIIFVGILVLDLYYDITSKMMEEHEKALLIKRAYTDDLTQINNRGYCTEYMDALQSNENSTYTIITFDLNGLKQANDTYGHTKGDLLIQTAAKVIADAFSDEGVVGRMGGDEFISILKTNDKNRIEALINSFNKLIEITNNENSELNLSISYGYATNNEVNEKNIEKVYQLADDRMYEYKKLLKNGR